MAQTKKTASTKKTATASAGARSRKPAAKAKPAAKKPVRKSVAATNAKPAKAKTAVRKATAKPTAKSTAKAAPRKKAAVASKTAAKPAAKAAPDKAKAAPAKAKATKPANRKAPAAKTPARTRAPAKAAPARKRTATVAAPAKADARKSKPMTPKSIAQKAAARRPAARKPVNQRHGFKTNEFVVYPAHGVGRIVAIEEQEIAGLSLELFVITFEKDKMTLRVPTGKLESVGMRKLAEDGIVKKAMHTLTGKARIKRTMWSRRAQEYEAKINSGDLVSIAEVVRDLYRSETQPEQSYSERQLYEAALDRMARELAAVEKLDERGAVQSITDVLSKSARGRRAAQEAEASDGEDAKAA